MNGERAWYQQWSKSKTKIENEISRKKKFLKMFFANSKAKNQKSKTKKLKNQDFSHTRVCVREKAKKG